jgi:hypothetical protein
MMFVDLQLTAFPVSEHKVYIPLKHFTLLRLLPSGVSTGDSAGDFWGHEIAGGFRLAGQSICS